jgi:hypothetical protein
MSLLGRTELPFTNGFYDSRSRALSSQRCINWYPNIVESPALSDENLYPTAGVDQVATAGGINRGSFLMNRRPYFVNGTRLFRLNREVGPDLEEMFTVDDLGEIAGTGRVRVAATGQELAIVVPGVTAYTYKDGDPSRIEITDPNFDGPVDDVVQINSFFVFCKTDTNKVFQSALNDGQSYNALDFATVPQVPVVVGMMVFRNQLYIMGDSLTVPFDPVGGLNFNFQPIPNAVLDIGLASVHAKTLFRSSFAFVGSGENAENSIWLFSGGMNRISIDPVDFLLQNQNPDQIAESFMTRLSQNGAEFVMYTVGDRCLGYDLSVGRWHERESRIGEEDFRWRVNSIVQAYNKIFVGDAVDGRIGRIEDELMTEYDNSMIRTLVTQPYFDGGNRVMAKGIEVYTDTGNGEDDLMGLRWSDNGGYNWSNQILRGMGNAGEYGRRVVFDRLGSFSNTRVLELTYTGPNPCAINKLMATTG